MTTIAICNHKGGTGKTTSVIHAAAALGLSGNKTLVLDLDPQGFLTRMLGLDEPAPEASVLALFDHETDVRQVPVQHLPGFDVLPSSSLLTKVMRKLNKPTDVLWTKESLEMGLDYDVVLIDTAAAVTVYSLNALVAAQHVLIPVTPEYQPVLGAEQTFQTVEMVRSRLNPGLGEPNFLFTQVDGRKNTHTQFRRYIRGKYGKQVLRSIIRTSTILSEQHSDGTTAFDHDAQSRGARDYANAVDELLQKIGYERPGPVGPSAAEAAAEEAVQQRKKPAKAPTAQVLYAAAPPSPAPPAAPPGAREDRSNEASPLARPPAGPPADPPSELPYEASPPEPAPDPSPHDASPPAGPPSELPYEASPPEAAFDAPPAERAGGGGDDALDAEAPMSPTGSESVDASWTAIRRLGT